MTIKEAFESLAKVTSKGMRNPFFVMRGLNKAFSEIAGSVEGGGGSSYSTSEIKAGKWIDGKDIYAKTIDMGISNNSIGMSYQTAHGIANFSHIVKCEFVAYKTNTSGFMVNCSVANSNLSTWSVEVTATQVIVWSNTAKPGYQGYCTIYYVK